MVTKRIGEVNINNLEYENAAPVQIYSVNLGYRIVNLQVVNDPLQIIENNTTNFIQTTKDIVANHNNSEINISESILPQLIGIMKNILSSGLGLNVDIEELTVLLSLPKSTHSNL